MKLPKAPEVIPLLKMLYSPDEVELLLSDVFTAPYGNSTTVEGAGEITGIEVSKLETKLGLNQLQLL